MKQIFHTNKQSRKLLQDCLKSHSMSLEEWAVFQDILKFRKEAEATAVLLNMSQLRFRSVEHLHEFFAGLQVAESLYMLRKTETELKPLWRAWKPFVKGIRRRNAFVKIFKTGLGVRTDLRSSREVQKRDNTPRLKEVDISLAAGYYISLKVEAEEERLYFFRALISWALYTHLRKLSVQELFKANSKWYPFQIIITINKGKIKVEKIIK